MPWWVGYLAEQGELEATRQDAHKLGTLGVSFDDLSKCGRCGKFGPSKDMRYHIVNGRSPAYCLPCHEVVERTTPSDFDKGSTS